MSPTSHRFAPALVAATLLAIGLFATAASAAPVTVTVDGNNYTIDTVTGSFNDHASQLTSQAWWNNATLAQDLTTTMNGQLGYPLAGSGNLSPIVGQSYFNPTYVLGDMWRQSDNTLLQLVWNVGDTTFNGSSTPSQIQWVVQVQPSNAPDNGATIVLLIVGLGALFLVSRRATAKVLN